MLCMQVSITYRVCIRACRYRNGADLLELCAEADMAPCMFLRRLLEQVPWTCNKNVSSIFIQRVIVFATSYV